VHWRSDPGAGDDQFKVSASDDAMHGENGSDTFTGGPGNDECDGRDRTDTASIEDCKTLRFIELP